jgi:hypothetical protein
MDQRHRRLLGTVGSDDADARGEHGSQEPEVAPGQGLSTDEVSRTRERSRYAAGSEGTQTVSHPDDQTVSHPGDHGDRS